MVSKLQIIIRQLQKSEIFHRGSILNNGDTGFRKDFAKYPGLPFGSGKSAKLTLFSSSYEEYNIENDSIMHH